MFVCLSVNQYTYPLTAPIPPTTTTTHAVTAVRPLGSTAGPGFPQAFPHDMARECEAASRKTRIQTQGNERALLSWLVRGGQGGSGGL